MNEPTLRSQRGAALVVGLLMLLALTLIGVTNMGMNSMELRMASNSQNKAHAFQAAESGLETGIAGTNFNDVDDTAQAIAPPVPALSYAQVTIQSDFMGFTGAASCIGQSIERIRCNNFEVNSVGQHVNSNASSNQTQGVYILAPQLRN